MRRFWISPLLSGALVCAIVALAMFEIVNIDSPAAFGVGMIVGGMLVGALTFAGLAIRQAFRNRPEPVEHV